MPHSQHAKHNTRKTHHKTTQEDVYPKYASGCSLSPVVRPSLEPHSGEEATTACCGTPPLGQNSSTRVREEEYEQHHAPQRRNTPPPTAELFELSFEEELRRDATRTDRSRVWHKRRCLGLRPSSSPMAAPVPQLGSKSSGSAEFDASCGHARGPAR